MTYGEQVKKIRKKYKLSQYEFAELLGTYPKRIYFIEKNRDFLTETGELILLTDLNERIVCHEN